MEASPGELRDAISEKGAQKERNVFDEFLAVLDTIGMLCATR